MLLSRRNFVKSTFATVCLQSILSNRLLSEAANHSRKLPNILLILTDDQGYGDVSCYPQDPTVADAPLRTPNIDSLAAQGIKFTQAYSICGICSPTRAGILTGRYPQFFGYYDNWEAQVGVPKDEMFLSDHLKALGYKTACIGKWHIGRNPGYRPLERGFDRFYGILQGQHDYFDPNIGEPEYGGGLAPNEFPSDQYQKVTKMKYFTDELTDKALEFIKQTHEKKQPFFMYLAYTAPHGPMQAPQELVRHYCGDKKPTQRDIVRAMIDSLDMNIGRIMDYLTLNGLDKDTLIIFTSDNGGHEDRDNQPTVHHNGGLHPRKGYVWEGGIRIPMIIKWTDHLPEGKIYDKPVIQLDIWPTIAAAAGTSQDPKKLDGVNLFPFITGQNENIPHETLYWARHKETKRWAVRHGKWKLINEIPDYKAQREVPYRTVYGLYDLESDFAEQHNLIDKYPDIAQKLQKLMDDFYAKCKPSIVDEKQTRKWHEEVEKRNKK